MKRLLVVLAVTLAVAPPGWGRVAGGPTPYTGASGAPTGLHAFLLSPDEPALQYYPRTPSFAWNPVAAKGGTYTFELATSRTFDETSVLFTYPNLKIPAVAVAHQLPWMTGVPYALWAHVRWQSSNGKVVTPWSQPFGFNLRWTDADTPQQLPAPPGMIRWKPIEGATAYQVLYPDLVDATPFDTTTNVADEREFFTFHDQFGWGATIHWRVRAVRYVDDKDVLKDGLPRATYGPWSKTFSSVNPPKALGVLSPTATVSDTWDTANRPGPHDLMPGFAWKPSAPLVDPRIGGVGSSLYRVYIFTDDHCVNQVFAGAVVGSPAYAPRTTGGPFALPSDTAALAKWDGPPYMLDTGKEADSFSATGQAVTPNEGSATASVDLWDSGWPSGRYYWTVVPVEAQVNGVVDSSSKSFPIEYRDMAVPQDECEAGFGMSFGKVSQPVVTASSVPWVSGLSPDGRMIASATKVPAVHDSPLVAWQPAIGATTYQVQLSRRSYPWVTTWSATTAGTSVVLPLGTSAVGAWYYRVRGINPALPSGAQEMSWSAPVKIRITGDSFVVVK